MDRLRKIAEPCPGTWFANREMSSEGGRDLGSHRILLRTLFEFSNEHLRENEILVGEKVGERITTVLNIDKMRAQNVFVKVAEYYMKSILNHQNRVVGIGDAERTVSIIECLYKIEVEDRMKIGR